MNTHDIRHRLTKIGCKASKAIRECGYTKDYDAALKEIIVDICNLGDDLDKEETTQVRK